MVYSINPLNLTTLVLFGLLVYRHKNIGFSPFLGNIMVIMSFFM